MLTWNFTDFSDGPCDSNEFLSFPKIFFVKAVTLHSCVVLFVFLTRKTSSCKITLTSQSNCVLKEP